MQIKAKVEGVGNVLIALRNIAERVPDVARGQFKRSARRIVEQAQINVPEDEGLLRDSIRIEKSYGDRGRLQIDIVAGGQTATTSRGRTIDLDQYAVLVHEAYETQVAPYGPGENTARKMARHPDAIIGSGFLTRAGEKEREAIERVLGEEITRIILRETT